MSTDTLKTLCIVGFANSILRALSTYLWCVCGRGGYRLHEIRVSTCAFWGSGILPSLVLNSAESTINSQRVQSPRLQASPALCLKQRCLRSPILQPKISPHCWQPPTPTLDVLTFTLRSRVLRLNLNLLLSPSSPPWLKSVVLASHCRRGLSSTSCILEEMWHTDLLLIKVAVNWMVFP